MTRTPDELVQRVAAAVLTDPAVADLHGGPLNAIGSYLPGGRLVGVRVGEPGEPVEVGVVLRLDRPIPDVVAGLRALVSRLCGGAAVDIVVGDVVGDVETGTRSGAPAVPGGDGRMVR